MELFVPGRICLFGEHSDWAGGYRRLDPKIEKGCAIIAGTNQGIYARVERHPDSLVLTSTTSDGVRHGPFRIPMKPAALREEAGRGGFWSYMCGVAACVLDRVDTVAAHGPQSVVRPRIGGLAIENFRTDLPVRKGLSSSAAVSVLTARAFNRVYELGLPVREEMELAYRGETATGSLCGRMDQGCAFGRVPVLMTFDGDELHTEELSIGGDLHFVLVDLRAGKDTRAILSTLNRCFREPGGAVEAGVRELLGPLNRRVVGAATALLRSGNAEGLGRLMAEAQALFDRYAGPACPGELTAPVLHRLLNYEPLQPHVWGGKGVGSQGDGAAQFVARSAADQRAAIECIGRDLRMPCLPLTLLPTSG